MSSAPISGNQYYTGTYNAPDQLPILNVGDLTTGTINGSVYPPPHTGSNLTQVLTQGNDATGQDMTNIGNVGLDTINNAVYPPELIVTENNTNDVFYPLFTSGSGVTPHSLFVNSGINPISVNPGTGDFIVDQTLKVGTNVAVGYTAGASQGRNSVAIGNIAGNDDQRDMCVAVGNESGRTIQGNAAIAIGNTAGHDSQGENSIAIGNTAGNARQGVNSIAIGNNAGRDRQGENSIAIGNNAGVSLNAQAQHATSIVINASGAALNSVSAGSCYVNPIRERTHPTNTTPGMLWYDWSNFEVVANRP
jgi:hypothetical protein